MDLKWITKKPTNDGFYWFKGKIYGLGADYGNPLDYDFPEMVKIEGESVWFYGDPHRIDPKDEIRMVGQWAGPIPEPKE